MLDALALLGGVVVACVFAVIVAALAWLNAAPQNNAGTSFDDRGDA